MAGLQTQIEALFNEALDLETLVPDHYAAYRPLIRDGLVAFLQALPGSRVMALVGEQLKLPATSTPAQRLVVLLHRCPTLHKLGQVLARDKRLAPELRVRLQELESFAPRVSFSEVTDFIRNELPDPSAVTLGDKALAEASVAVIVPFTWGSRRQQRGVFKVIKPGVANSLREELAAWQDLAGHLEQRSAVYGLPAVNYRETLDSVQQLLDNELRLDLEQQYLAEAGQFYRDTPEIIVPRLLPFCTPHLTAMEFIDGVKVTEARGDSARLAERLVNTLVARPFWSPDGSSGPFHGDPHAGNLLVTPDGRLALLDWSLSIQLTPEQRQALMQILIGAISFNSALILRSIDRLAAYPGDEEHLVEIVENALTRVRWGEFPGFDWMTDLFDRLVTEAGATFPPELVMFRKALLTLAGVVSDISPTCHPDRVLLRAAWAQFFADLPQRVGATPDSRSFASHLSNNDLVQLWLHTPAATARYWEGAWEDWMRLWRQAA